jgi:hypothetical protein
MALVSLVVGLAGVNYDFEAFSDPASLIAIGSSAAVFIRWSYWLNMLGNYLFLIPLALFLYQWLKSVNPSFAQLFTASGLLYLVLGAAGSAMFAAAWPLLIELYESAPVEQRPFLVVDFAVVNALAGEGLHGVLQDLVGAVWFLGMGYLLRTKRNGLGIFTMTIGGFLILNTIGNILNIEALSLIGLTANIVLGPLWAIWLGTLLVLRKVE